MMTYLPIILTVFRSAVYKKKPSAFSLIEISIVLIIIGILMGAVFKGQDLLENAKLQSVANDFHNISLAVYTYHDSYGVFPGDDDKASLRFGSSIANGNGNGSIDSSEETLVWVHLNSAGDFPSSIAPSSKFGDLTVSLQRRKVTYKVFGFS